MEVVILLAEDLNDKVQLIIMVHRDRHVMRLSDWNLALIPFLKLRWHDLSIIEV